MRAVLAASRTKVKTVLYKHYFKFVIIIFFFFAFTRTTNSIIRIQYVRATNSTWPTRFILRVWDESNGTKRLCRAHRSGRSLASEHLII